MKRIIMDDKNLKGGQDRDRVAGGEEYEVEYLAKQLGVSKEEVQAAIKAVGNNREKVTAYVKGKK